MEISSSTWFIPGYQISRHIMFSQLPFYLGQNATVRVFTYRGREGYLVTAPGQGLTKHQIEDLKSLSKQYEENLANKMVGYPEINAPVAFSGAGGSSGHGPSSSYYGAANMHGGSYANGGSSGGYSGGYSGGSWRR